MLVVVLNAVSDYDDQGEDEEDVWCDWDVCQILKRTKPAYRDQDDGSDEDVEAF